MFRRQNGCWDNGGVFDDNGVIRDVSIYEDECLGPIGYDRNDDPVWPWVVEIDGERYEGLDFLKSRTMFEPYKYRAFVCKVTPTGHPKYARRDVIGDFWYDTHEDWVRGITKVIEDNREALLKW